MQKKINKVAITGGTHGNELTGVYLIKKFARNSDLIKRDSFETICMLTNTQAIKQCTRYIDKDLNRTFTCKDLKDPSLGTYEDKLAKELNNKLGPRESKTSHVDFIMDLHTTTSNMGLSLCISTEDKLTWQVAAYVKEHLPQLNIFRWQDNLKDPSYVCSISPSGFTIEVGAIAQGVLRADKFEDTQMIVQHILDFFELYNSGNLKKPYKCIEVYEHVELVDYPRDENNDIAAMVHPDLQDNDYKQIKKGDPLFVTFYGKTICYEKKKSAYAVFINEAAYYEKGFAMDLTQKIVINI